MSLRVAGAPISSAARRTVHRFRLSSEHANGRHAGPVALPVMMALALGAAIVVAPAVIALFVPLTVGVVFLLFLERFLRDPDGSGASDSRLMHWMMAAFVLHLLFGLAVTYSPAAVRYLGGDAYGYHIYAKWMLEFGRGSLAEKLPAGKEGFFYALLGLYKVFGPHMEAGLALNATLAAGLVPLVTDTTRRLFGPFAARWVAPIVVLLPSFFLFTSQLLKEAPILFLFAAGMNAAVRILERISLSAVIVVAVSLALLFTLRAPVALVGGVGLLLSIALGRRQVLSGLTSGLGAFAVLAVIVTLVGVGSTGLKSAVERSNLKEANRQRTGLAFQSNSAFAVDVDTATPRQAVAYLPVALVNFTLGPFPWQIHGVRQLPVVLDVLALWILWPSFIRGVGDAIRKRGPRAAALLLPAVATACVLSLAVGNFGVLMRERMQVVILVVPFMAAGMAVKARPSGGAPSEAPALVPA